MSIIFLLPQENAPERERDTQRKMKRSSIFIAFFLIYSSIFSSQVNSQANDSCSSQLELKGQLPFETSSLNCNPVWAAHGFILRYAQAEPKVWNFVLTAPDPNGYIAIGFSPNGRMVGSSAIAGWVGANGVPAMKKYFLSGQTPSLVVPDKGNLTLGNSTIVLENSQIHMFFQLVNTDRPESRLIYAVGPNGLFPSTATYRLTEHRDMVSTALNYATGQSQTKKDPNASLRRSHGILNMLSWGILMPMGVMVARYLRKYDPLWFYLHTMIQSLGFIFGVAGVICGFVLNNRLHNNVDRHKGIGITILAFGCLQVIAFLARPTREAKVRKYWNWYHYTVGRVMILLAVINIFYGIHLGNAGSGWNAGYSVVLVIFFITGIVLELRMWMRK